MTWHLRGSLPEAHYPPARKMSAGAAFVWMDRYLDRTRTGPRFLVREDVALVVVERLKRGETLGHYDLGAYAVMSNHVHVLLLPKIPSSQLLNSLKGTTAREANLRLGLTGQSFWQRESYDHWVRNEEEWHRIAAYIEQNPVNAGLVREAEQYRWSSAAERSKDVEPGSIH